MKISIDQPTALALSAGTLLLLCGTSSAQYPAPVRPTAILGAPIPVEERPLPEGGQVVSLPVTPPPLPSGGPSLPFLGARYSFQGQRAPCQTFNYYGPGYTAPQFFNPRYPNPGPYYSTPTYPYVSSYYSYYYTPGFFRY